MIPVSFVNGASAFETLALLDSGADCTAMIQEVAEALDLDISGPRERAYGLGGSIDAVATRVDVAISKEHEHYRMTIPVKVLLAEATSFPPILGRRGFFDEFKITFEEAREKVTLRKVRTID